MTGAATRRSGRITVVDDSHEFLDLMRLVLEPRGYVVTCFSQAATVQALVDSRPNLLIIDLRLEQPPTALSGWDLVVLASHHAELHDIPILVCSADLPQLNERSRSVQGAERLHALAKPFELDQLESLVDRLVRIGRGARPASAAG
jgi:CheY-like chemotaxis protein